MIASDSKADVCASIARVNVHNCAFATQFQLQIFVTTHPDWQITKQSTREEHHNSTMAIASGSRVDHVSCRRRSGRSFGHCSVVRSFSRSVVSCEFMDVHGDHNDGLVVGASASRKRLEKGRRQRHGVSACV